MEKTIHAIIPARGGSKGIKNKNVINILGKPLIAWSIELAKKCPCIDEVYVTTDSQQIQKVALSCGAKAPYLRPAKISGDNALDIDFMKFHIDWLGQNDIDLPSCIVHLRPTGPARCVDDLCTAVEIMKADPSLTGLRSVALSKLTPYKMWKMSSKSILSYLFPDEVVELHSTPRQGLERVFWQNGYIDIVKPSTLLTTGSMVGDNCYGLLTSDEVVDLDYVTDIPMIERSLHKIQTGEVQSYLTDELPNHSV